MLIAILPLMLIALHPSQGTALYGASRWIDLGPITIQPAEFLKLGLVAFAATVLANKWRKIDDLKHLVMPLAPVLGFFALLVIMQRDLGTTIVICGSVFALMFVAGVRMRYLAWTGFGGMLVVGYLVFGEAYRRTRFVDSFLNPWNDPKGSGFQLIQGLIALGSGGWTGVGLGASRQKWDYLPNAHSDFIFAIIGEELGLLGAFFVLVMFGLLLFAGIRIAVRAPDTFGRFLAAGVTA
jgi:cell division protein FtsW